MKTLKFAFLMLGFCCVAFAIYTIVTGAVITFTADQTQSNTSFVSRMANFFAVLGYGFVHLAIGLICFLGAKLAAILDRAGVAEDLRAFVSKLREAE